MTKCKHCGTELTDRNSVPVSSGRVHNVALCADGDGLRAQLTVLLSAVRAYRDGNSTQAELFGALTTYENEADLISIGSSCSSTPPVEAAGTLAELNPSGYVVILVDNNADLKRLLPLGRKVALFPKE